ncbi:unnamed protein product [Rotaria sp. Silwood2]|nr:unnamed protein product [Rotaria sp. Silwood2]CAF2641967.1 unnamed protein product [Rotaria sp. Silwood2]CAF3359594.1 unnamed protein product [Rotaria sp. Silwood2]CAF4197876.1 unnamed protein product [Rotaria sp. Silwood2]CAF4272796.1 unnamed protein product [Rotaria sp. Silwood2]
MLLGDKPVSIFLSFYSLLLLKNIDAQFSDSGSMAQFIQSILSGNTIYKANEDRKKFVPVKVSPDVYGNWTYRSFMNHPDETLSFNDLYFALATLEITDSRNIGILQGRLIFSDNADIMSLQGSIHYGYPFTLRFQGIGSTPNIKNFTYDYIGFLVPQWPNGIDQRPSIVGSVIRTLPHGDHPAGEVASFIAVKRNYE